MWTNIQGASGQFTAPNATSTIIRESVGNVNMTYKLSYYPLPRASGYSVVTQWQSSVPGI